MRKRILSYAIVILSILPFCLKAQQNTWTCKNASVSFFSSAPLEDIEAVSVSGASALNTETGEIVFKVKNTSFQFDKKMMQEHFNENYMESDKYPISEFKGVIKNASALSQIGKQVVVVAGTLNVHGISRNYETEVEIVVEKGVMTASCIFNVKLEDHHIKIPSVVGMKIAEQVKVSVLATYKQ